MTVLAKDLRDAVLQAAFQGKLTKQLDTDSSVDELLKSIKENEMKNFNWTSKKKLEIEDILNAINNPKIPDNWKWVKLSDIAFSNIGLTYKPINKVSNGTIVLRSSNIQNGKMDYSDIVSVDMKIPDSKKCNSGDILMCVRNGSKHLVGKVAIIDRSNMAFGAFMAIIKSRCNQFLYYFFYSDMFKKQMHINSSTETINQITQNMLFNCIIPLPPIEEQQRIVDKVEKLMKKIDEYETFEKQLEELKKSFPDDMKDAILQAAMQGKLTKQLDSDTDVNKTLNLIKKEVSINRPNNKANRIESIEIDDIPYNIPNSWKWVRLGEVTNIIRGLTFSTSYKNKKDNTIIVLRGGNIDSKTEELIFKDNIYVEKTIPKDNQFLKKGDCLIVASSGTKSSIGKSCYIDKIDDNVSFGGFMMVIRPNNKVNSKLISYYIKQYRQKIINNTVGYISNITNSILNNLLIPFPPIEDQERIVEKLDKILLICESLSELI